MRSRHTARSLKLNGVPELTGEQLIKITHNKLQELGWLNGTIINNKELDKLRKELKALGYKGNLKQLKVFLKENFPENYGLSEAPKTNRKQSLFSQEGQRGERRYNLRTARLPILPNNSQ